MKLTVDEFMEKFNGAPWDMEELAAKAARVTDNKELSGAARAYSLARRNLEAILEEIGYEFG